MGIDLKKWRKDNHLTQTAAAKMLGVSIYTYQNWERKVSTPSAQNLEKILQVVEQ